jgi:lipopolysaccharide biosynthesis glycosyltransferase
VIHQRLKKTVASRQRDVEPVEPLRLVLAADEQFAMPLAVTLFTALRGLQHSDAVEVRVFDGGITDLAKRRVREVVKRARPNAHVDLDWVTPPGNALPSLDKYRFANTAITRATFYRFAVPDIFPSHAERAIFLDADVLVRANLRKFEELIPENAPLLAVRDYGMPTFKHRSFRKETCAGGVTADPELQYFNAGILGINLALWRKKRVSEKARDIVAEHPYGLRFNDQDALNLALGGAWQEAPLEWNLGAGGPDYIQRVGGDETEFLGEPYEQIRKRAKIIHFTGYKPWEQGFTNPDRPAFVRELKACGWFRPLEFRAWQAKWWANLVRRVYRKRYAGEVGRRVSCRIARVVSLGKG